MTSCRQPTRPHPHPWRRALNYANLATPTGLLLSVLARAERQHGPHGLILAGRCRRFVPSHAMALCVGDVVLSRRCIADLLDRPAMLAHEAKHARQWATWVGVVGFPLAYVAASAWSYLRTGNAAHGNYFEKAAGLVDGGYLPAPTASGREEGDIV